MTNCSPTTITIMTENEEELTLDTSSARLVYRSGLNYGTYVIAEYQGDDPTTAKMTAVYDYTGESTSDGSEDQQAASDEIVDENQEEVPQEDAAPQEEAVQEDAAQDVPAEDGQEA